jgi:hypothetical protein
MTETTTSKPGAENLEVNRRTLLASGGLGILGSTFLGSTFITNKALGNGDGSPACEGVEVPAFQKKPVELAGLKSRDLAEHAMAEMLFWDDIMMEHSLFLAILMPTADLNNQRNKALDFKNMFADQLTKLRGTRLEMSNLTTVIRNNNEMVKRLHEFKLQTKEDQLAGRIHTLVWPEFFTHTAREAERFTKRLENIGRGELELEGSEVVEFWTETMGEHAQFISHLLDPQEVALIEKADETAKAFFAARTSTPANLEPLAKEIINFKEAALQGIATGKIKSIILPALADHVRREALKFADELKRIK